MEPGLVRITGTPKHTYQYDLSENLTEIKENEILNQKYSYNTMGRLERAEARDGKRSLKRCCDRLIKEYGLRIPIFPKLL